MNIKELGLTKFKIGDVVSFEDASGKHTGKIGTGGGACSKDEVIIDCGYSAYLFSENEGLIGEIVLEN